MRLMGLDIGTKRIGVAVSDELGLLAQGRDFIDRRPENKAFEKIEEYVTNEKVGRIVVGLPLNMDGSEGERAADSRLFAELLGDKVKVPIELWDERLSTKEARDIMITADVSRKKRKTVIDKMAAQLILQGYLDAKAQGLEK